MNSVGGATARISDLRYARAARESAARAHRDTVFAEDAGLFGDPAWDILVGLYAEPAGPATGQQALPDHIAPTVAERYVKALLQRGLAERGDDARGRLVLSAKGRGLLDRCFAG